MSEESKNKADINNLFQDISEEEQEEIAEVVNETNAKTENKDVEPVAGNDEDEIEKEEEVISETITEQKKAENINIKKETKTYRKDDGLPSEEEIKATLEEDDHVDEVLNDEDEIEKAGIQSRKSVQRDAIKYKFKVILGFAIFFIVVAIVSVHSVKKAGRKLSNLQKFGKTEKKTDNKYLLIPQAEGEITPETIKRTSLSQLPRESEEEDPYVKYLKSQGKYIQSIKNTSSKDNDEVKDIKESGTTKNEKGKSASKKKKRRNKKRAKRTNKDTDNNKNKSLEEDSTKEKKNPKRLVFTQIKKPSFKSSSGPSEVFEIRPGFMIRAKLASTFDPSTAKNDDVLEVMSRANYSGADIDKRTKFKVQYKYCHNNRLCLEASEIFKDGKWFKLKYKAKAYQDRREGIAMSSGIKKSKKSILGRGVKGFTEGSLDVIKSTLPLITKPIQKGTEEMLDESEENIDNTIQKNKKVKYAPVGPEVKFVLKVIR